MSLDDLRHPPQITVPCFVLTVSDTRTEETDTSGRAIVELLTRHGHEITGRVLVRDEPADVARVVTQEVARGTARVIFTTGGTGIARRDRTFDALSSLLETRIDGFGELFRSLSYAEIGPAAMLSRAAAGTIGRTAIFMLPGSNNAVHLALSRLVLPQLGHLVRELDK